MVSRAGVKVAAASVFVVSLTLGAAGWLMAAPPDEPAGPGQAPHDPAPIRFEGRGPRATATFPLHAGLVVWTVKHGGRSNVQVHLLDDQGSQVDTPLNEIGKVDGSIPTHLRREGTYRLQVDADGPWSVAIAQPTPADPPSAPREFRGKGRRATEFFTLSAGSHVVAARHSGKGIFRVQVLDAEGRFLDQAAGVVGGFDGSKAVKIDEPGAYLLKVVADGAWTVTVD